MLEGPALPESELAVLPGPTQSEPEVSAPMGPAQSMPEISVLGVCEPPTPAPEDVMPPDVLCLTLHAVHVQHTYMSRIVCHATSFPTRATTAPAT